MKGPSIDDSRRSVNQGMTGIPQANHHGGPMQAGYLIEQIIPNSNGNNSASRIPYGNLGSRMSGFPNIQTPPENPQNGAEDLFADYAWMGDEDEFDRQVIEQMEQEAFFEACVQQLCSDDTPDECTLPGQGDGYSSQLPNESMGRLTINEPRSNTVLNPNAVEFVPRRVVTQK